MLVGQGEHPGRSGGGGDGGRRRLTETLGEGPLSVLVKGSCCQPLILWIHEQDQEGEKEWLKDNPLKGTVEVHVQNKISGETVTTASWSEFLV